MLQVRKFVEILRERALEGHDRQAYTFLSDDGTEVSQWTFGELDRRARAIAVALQEQGADGERTLLLYPPGLDFIAGFLGCLYAGSVAVPVYPPSSSRTLPRFLAICRDAQPAAALTTTSMLPRLVGLARHAPELAAIQPLAADALPLAPADRWRGPGSTGETLAFLQYTSGSTALPKGVMVSHGNLLHNEEMIRQAFGQTQESVIVSWLPFHHDMGLIGGVLQPLYVGARCILMSPMTFLQKPRRWLEAISRYRATTSGGPNFAYDLCAQKITEGERRGLDLSSWEVAFNGAEPVRDETLERFAESFAPCGFRRRAFYPCYGLAEGTLLVAGGAHGTEPRVEALEAAALERNQVAAGRGGAADRRLVSCGWAWLDQKVVIADLDTSLPCPQDRVGEIWVCGPSVARGYWGRPELTERDFGARLADTGEGPFLRTGDLGFLAHGELFVTGRSKDLMIVRGRNLYPQDLELTADRCQPSLRFGSSAAFSLEVEGEERVVLVQEVDRRSRAQPGALAAAIRAAVAEEHEVRIHEVLLVRSQTLPRTSSGKLQRYACRKAYLEGSLEVVARTAVATSPASAGPVLDREGWLALEPGERRPLLDAYLREQVAQLMRLDADLIEPDQPLTAFGVDSLAAVELKNRLEAALDAAPTVVEILAGPTLLDLGDRILKALEAGLSLTEQVSAVAAETAGSHPLSHGQRGLWFLDRLHPGNPANIVARAVWIRGGLDTALLRSAFQQLLERHRALRTTYYGGSGEPRAWLRTVDELGDSWFREEEAAAWGAAALAARLAEEAYRPFDLEDGPLLRIAVFHRSPREHAVLLSVHHLAVDLWSLGVLLRELGALYAAAGGPVALEPLPVQYADFVLWQERLLAGPRGEELLAYWERRLGGLDPLDLPTDRPRPPVQSFRGGSRRARLPERVGAGLDALARTSGATLFMTLLAGLSAVLRRYTSQSDLAVGTPTARRESVALAGLVGYFVNPVVVRVDLAGAPGFGELLHRIRDSALEAFEHQECPFPLLVERLQPDRGAGRSPLFQAMLSLQQERSPQEEGLAGLALGELGVEMDLGGLRLESLPLEERGAPFDLILVAAQVRGALAVSLQYSTDLFDAATIERMLGHLARLLAAAAEDPIRPVSELPLLAAAEHSQIVVEWNDTGIEALSPAPVHELFEAQVLRAPEAVAVGFGDERLTYEELNRRADRLARCLAASGVGAESLVGICIERSPAMLVALLGIMKSGGAYLPLDPSHPRERLAAIIEEARPSVMLTQTSLRTRLPAGMAHVVNLDVKPQVTARLGRWEPEGNAGLDNLVYVIFTSGSTGRPKGVQIPHRALANFLGSMQRRPGIEAQDVLLAVTTLSFDIAALELLLPLLSGARVELASREVVMDGPHLCERLASSGATVMQATPSTWRMLLDTGWQGDRRLKVLCGGEALPADLAERLLPWTGELWNLYGPTETTVWSAARAVGCRESPVRVGGPIANTGVYLLDHLEPVPMRVIGELHLSGAGLARGYLDRPDLTAERFIPDPFAAEPGARMYRTGDLARWLADGEIELLGRSDHQVKVRGFRIELGEIEVVLGRHPGVREAVAAVWQEGGDSRLAAYVVVAVEPGPEGRELRAWLSQRLPDFMVPSAFVRLDTLPRTPNGKIDRRALPAPVARRAATEALIAPRTPVEELLAGIWAEVLDVEAVGVLDNFFELGGHSLQAVQVGSRARETFPVDVPVRWLFEAPTIAGLAARIEAAATAGQPASREMLTPIRRVRRQSPLPLSFAQQRLWFLDQLAPDNPFYNMYSLLRLQGELDVRALDQTFQEIVQRHEILRTTFQAAGGEPTQVIHPAAVALPVIDLGALPEGERWAIAERLSAAEARRPFVLDAGPLFRVVRVRLSADDSLLLLNMHHIVSDGWSLGVMHREFLSLYRAFCQGRPSPLPELPIQYADFSVWQRKQLQGAVLESLLAYWHGQLRGAPSTLELPADHPRPLVETFRGAELAVCLGAPLVAGVRALSRRACATVFMTALAAFKALLSRYSGRSDLVVGTAVANRTSSAIEDLIGFFANVLVLRTDLSGTPSFRDILGRVREVTLGAFSHQDLPFEKLVDELQIERSLSSNPLCQVLLVFQNFPWRPGDAPSPGLRITPLEGSGADTRTAKFDFILFLWEGPGGTFAGKLQFSSDLFEETTVQRLLGHFETVLEQVVRDPQVRLPAVALLTEPERQQLCEWTTAGAFFPGDRTLHRLFETVAGEMADAPAVTCEGHVLTYGELDRRSNQLAHRLRRLGVGPEVLVGVAMERSLEMVVSLLGTLKAGGAYLPLDPSYPRERLAFLRRDSAFPVLLTQSQLAGQLAAEGVQVLCLDGDWRALAGESRESPAVPFLPDSLAYVIYTSGSTGRPKGVQVTHGNVVRLFAATEASFGFHPGDVWTLFHSYAFDFSVWEIWGALLYGGRLVVVPHAVSRSPEAFLQLLAAEQVTVLNQTPSAFRQLMQADREASPDLALLWIVFGGEALEFESLRPWFEAHGDSPPRLVNMYGITETTVHVTERPVRRGDLRDGQVQGSRVGRPLADLRVHLLDYNLHPVPVGVPGEIFVGGAGVARGYLRRPELTAERFIPDPFGDRPGERLYRSGDLARYLPTGELVHLGRVDHQVKVRGFRIELGEIESVLSQHPRVREAVVVAREDTGDRRLVAYLVHTAEPQAEEEEAEVSEQIAQWTKVFDDTYGRLSGGDQAGDPTFDISGWNSSYTGGAIPAEEMREWVDRTVERIVSLAPRRVLEIGSGTGLLLFRVAPRVASYLGWDFSPVALDGVRRHLEALNGDLSHVRLEQRAADDFRGMAPDSLDAVLLNSVAQYFPSVEYLLEVVEKAVEGIEPGGFLFVGDVRSLPLAEAFHASVELARAPDALPLARLRQRVEWQVRHEEELLLDPGFFLALQNHLPKVGRVEILPKRGRYLNELTRFRYDVVVHVGPDAGEPRPAAGLRWLDWEAEGLDLDLLRQLLASRTALALRRLPNARLSTEVRTLHALAGDDGGIATVGELRRSLTGPVDGIDPEDLWALSEELGYRLRLSWAAPEPEGRFSALFVPLLEGGTDDWVGFLEGEAASRPWASYANRPLRAKLARRWLPQLQAFVKERLPEHMLPAAYVLLEALPLTGHGKVDRRVLPAPDTVRPELEKEYSAPRSPLEAALAEVWGKVLDLDRVGIHDGFFELGGDSIRVVRLVSRVNERLASGLRVQDVFRYQTIAEMAEHLATTAAAGGVEEEKVAGLERIERLRQAVLADERQRSRLPAAYDDFYPLSGVERGMVYHSLLRPEEPVYYDQFVYLLRLENFDRFFKAFELLVDRHPVFRSGFYLHDFDEPLKVVYPAVPVARDVEDLSALPETAQRLRIDAYRSSDLDVRLDFAGDLLWRLKLFRLRDALYCVVWSWHHAMLDGWSNVSFWVELNDLLKRPDLDVTARLPKLDSDYKDYVAISLGRKRSAETEAFWRDLLAGHGRSKLPFQRTKARRDGALGMRARVRELSADLLDALRSKALEHHVSLQAIYLSAHLYLLSVTAGEDDLVTGIVTHDRPGTRDGDRIIGCFLNTVPIRVDVAALADGAALVQQVNRLLSEEKLHEIPLVDIAVLVGAKASAGNPLFDTIFNYMDFHVVQGIENSILFKPAAGAALPSAYSFAPHEMTNTLFDVEVSVTRGESFVKIKYSPQYFDEAEIEKAVLLYESILARFARDLRGRIGAEDLLSPAERQEVLHRFNDTAAGFASDKPIHRLFEEQAAAAPDRPAVRCAGLELTYRELNQRANRLARHLRDLGVTAGESVGLIFPRSVDLVVGMMSILKAGATYVPMEPDHPAARKGYVVRSSKARRVLADRRYELEPTPEAGELFVVADPGALEIYEDTDLDLRPAPGDLAYTIYTSGSTGRPKGVMIEHRSAVNLIQWVNREFGVDGDTVLLMASSVCFDLSVYDVFGSLGVGATVVMVGLEDLRDPARLMRLVAAEKVTFWNSVPSTMGNLVQYLEEMEPDFRQEDLRVVFLSGDWIPLALPPKVERFFPKARVISLGGATEATVWSNFYPVERIDDSWVSIPYGRPIQNSSFYVLDRALDAVPGGVVGELFIGGVGVARGYVGDPEKTAAAFLPDRFARRGGERMYRTGDLGRMMPGGNLEFLGRTDHQVKIRGFRVELGEIESRLLQHPAVREAVVVDRQDCAGEKYLCAYVVSPDGVEAADLRRHLACTLPEYMVANTFVHLPQLPLTANGKVDRRALPEPDLESLGIAVGYQPPAGEVEAALVEIWEEVLGMRGVGTRHDFFELGGHSLSAVQVVTRIRRRFGVDFPLRSFFDATTVARLAEIIDDLAGETATAPDSGGPRLIRGERSEPPPLSVTQERFWFLQQLEPETSAFNMTVSVQLSGRLRIEALAASLDEVLRRHESLRARFSAVAGRPVQVIAAPWVFALPLIDLEGLEPAVRDHELRRVPAEVANRPFDLARGSLLRGSLLRLAHDEHIAVFVMHHIVGDGWSVAILCRELGDLYEAFSNGRPSPLAELPIQYGDYVHWQRGCLHGELLETHLGYWRRRLGGMLPDLSLPFARPRPGKPRFRGAAQRLTLPRDLAAALARLSQREGATLFMTLLAAFKALLHLYTGQEDLVIGTNVANRNRDEVEGVIGSFINNLVLRTSLAGAPSFRELLGRVRETALEAYSHQDVPFETVIEDLQPQRRSSFAPLFRVMFVFQNFPFVVRELPGLRWTPLELRQQTAAFDLVLTMSEEGEGLSGSFVYDTDLFDAASIARMADYFSTLLQTVAADPDRRLTSLPVVSEAEIAWAADAFNEDFQEDLI